MTIQQMVGTIPEWTRADRLRKAREVTGLTSREFAERVGVSQKTISDAENGRRKMRKILMNAWALASGVSLEWLETGQAPDHDSGPGPDGGLPRLDSNQQPSVVPFMQVRSLRRGLRAVSDEAAA